jgi:glycosyltransferase involved in cell wall biosynthesis
MTKPIIATNLGGSKDIILNNQTGWLIKEKDPEELAKKIVKVIKMSQTDKDKVGNSARKRVIDNFGIKQMLDKETIIYDELIKRKHSYN